MPLPPDAKPPADHSPSAAGILSRIADTTKIIFTVSDQMSRLAKEDERSQNQILELTKLVFKLSNDVSNVAGQMQTIEKRLDDKEKLLETTFTLRLRDEIDRALKRDAP